MRLSKLSLILFATIVCLSSSGCSLPFFSPREGYLPEGSVAEIARPTKVKCYITNKATGKKEIRTIPTWPGYYLARPKTAEFGEQDD